MRRVRASYEIARDILWLCRKPMKLTWIMMKANLSHRTATKYLGRLKSLGLIEEDTVKGSGQEGRNFLYKTTDEGFWVLESMKRIKILLDKEASK